MANQKIVVTGAGGQLGRELQVLAPGFPGFDFIFLSRDQLPIDHFEEVRQFIKAEKPLYCINCAAYTAVDRAESEKEMAFLVNGDAAGELAAACQSVSARLVHISTDYVFDGSTDTALKEDDPTSPVNVYGASKRLGEELVLRQNSDSIVIRTSWLYSAFGSNFVKTMIRLMNDRESVNVVSDQIGSPTYAGDLARVILQIISSGKFVPGIYHYSNEGRISWYEFALEIRKLIQSGCQVHPIPSSQYPTAARRPQFSLLDKSKIRKLYAISLPDWKSSLEVCIGELKKKTV
jgi:dTDP-4-dehydrorhamnose reductase